MVREATRPNGAALQRAPLSRESVLDEAMALGAEEGPDALSLRRLAQRIGVTPMALYWHYKNKDDLLVGIADRLWQLVDVRVSDDLPWPDRLRHLMESVVRALRAHAFVVPVLMSVPLARATASLRVMDAALGILTEAGFPPARSAALCRLGLESAIGVVLGTSSAAAVQTPEERAQAGRHKRDMLSALPADHYPHVVSVAAALATFDDPDEYLQTGLDVFIAGVVALAPPATG